ncbi:hypothetical protein ACOMHN_046300 [Nucella lapillus]
MSHVCCTWPNELSPLSTGGVPHRPNPGPVEIEGREKGEKSQTDPGIQLGCDDRCGREHSTPAAMIDVDENTLPQLR